MHLEITDQYGTEVVGKDSRNRTELALRFGYTCKLVEYTEAEMCEWWTPFIEGSDHWHDDEAKFCFMVVED